MSPILRDGLLADVSVVVQRLGGSEDSALTDCLQGLGARVGSEPLGALVLDCSGWVPDPAGGDTGVGPLQDLLDRVWVGTESVANGSFIPGGEGGRIVFVGPARLGEPTVTAAVAALENLARTLSVEWARYGITTVLVAPGPGTRDEDLGTVIGYLLSVGGAYFSGCRLDLDAAGR